MAASSHLLDALPQRDSGIVAGKAQLHAQQRAFATQRCAKGIERHARALHIIRGDVAFVDDADLFEADHADRRPQR